LDRSAAMNVRRTTPTGTVYYVNDQFVRRYARDHRSLAQVESMADQQYFKKVEGEVFLIL